MAEETHPSPSSSIFTQKNSPRLADDTVFFSIFPDFSVPTQSPNPNSTAQLQSLHLEIIQFLSPHTSSYIWQHQPFTLSPSSADQIPHFHGKLRYGDNLEDEWFVVFLLFEISRKFPNLSIRVWDTDGEFLLIEAAFHLPRWLNPNNSTNRVFIRRGNLHIISQSHYPSTPTLLNSLFFLINSEESKSIAADAVQLSIKNRIKGFSERPDRNIHKVRVRVPVLVAQVLKHEPSLISLAVEGFYDRDIDSMKYAAKMDRFLPNGSGEEFVEVLAKMSKAMYGQLVQQTFQAPKCYPMPVRSEGGYAKAELGMKIACGFEMIFQLRKRDAAEGKGVRRRHLGRVWKRVVISEEYRGLMENAEEYYRNSSLHSRARHAKFCTCPLSMVGGQKRHFNTTPRHLSKGYKCQSECSRLS